MMCASTTLTPLRLSARVSPHLRVVADLDAGQSSSLTVGVNYCFFLLTECKVTVHKTCEAKVSYTFSTCIPYLLLPRANCAPFSKVCQVLTLM